MQRLSSKSFKDYLKTIIACDNWHIGTVDNNKEKAIGIYSNKRQASVNTNFRSLQTYNILPVVLKLRWTKNYNDAESKAFDIYELLCESSFSIDTFDCCAICPLPNPIDLGADDNGIYMFSIDVDIFYKERRI